MPVTSIRRVEADGVWVFYRAAGDPDLPVVLLLHGFPTSSFMFRELIPRLASDYRVIAPDLPGFGFKKYFRKVKPPLLAIWGKNAPFFIPAGAEAFRKDIPSAHVEFLDTGHFALETHVVEIAARMKGFLSANGGSQ